ncbi:MAG: DUF2110 family protein [Candidatus Bathyarchaeota archaeon]|nr:DUF2110 family protein [Candidatus Bathyarchaeota archaeon]
MIVSTSGRLYGYYRDRCLGSLDAILRDSLRGLKVDYKVFVDGDGWIDIELEGEDISIAARIVEKLIGARPRSMDDLGRRRIWVGRIKAITGECMVIDMKLIEAVVAPRVVSIQLEDSYEEAVARYGLYPNVPIEVVVDRADSGRRYIAYLSDGFLAKLHRWGVIGLNRVSITGATSSIVRRCLKKTGMERYVAYYERLGILEHHIVCKIASNPYKITQTVRNMLKDVDVYVAKPRPIGYLTLLHS